MVEEEPKTLEEYRRLTQQQRMTIKKPALQIILDAIASDDEIGTSGEAVMLKLNEIHQELKDVKEKNARYDDEIKRLKDTINE